MVTTNRLIRAVNSRAVSQKDNPNNLPNIKAELVKRQGGKCPISGVNLRSIDPYNVVVDHDHQTGIIRAALTRSSNGLEGKLKNLCIRWGRCTNQQEVIRMLRSVADYLEYHLTPQTEWLHPDHLTPMEKRAKTNTAARKKRAALKKKV